MHLFVSWRMKKKNPLLKKGTDTDGDRMELGSVGVCCATSVASQPMLQAGFGSQ